MEYLQIDNYSFELYENINQAVDIREKQKKIIEFCDSVEAKTFDMNKNLFILLEVFPHPLNGVRYHLDYINLLDENMLKIKLIDFSYCNYIGFLKDIEHPKHVIEKLKKLIKNNKYWSLNNNLIV